jgi:transglutaminase-like putative cysteine protease
VTKIPIIIATFALTLVTLTSASAAKRQIAMTSKPFKTTVASKATFSHTKSSNSDVAQILKSAPTSAQFPNAAAATVLDASDVTIKPDGTVIEEDHEMLRIFNDRARDESDIAIPFSSSTQTLSELKARTILPNGHVVPLDPSDVHITSPFAGYAMYDDSKIASFSMPGVQDGSIIDYSYTLTYKPLLPHDFSETWLFADGNYPVKISRFRVTAPSDLKIASLPLNAPTLKPVIKIHGNVTSYYWAMTNLSDIDREPMMPPDRYIFPMVQVSLLDSWQDISHWFYTLAKNREVITPELHQLVLQQTAGKTTDSEKAKALFYWVEQNIRYVAVELGESAWQPHLADQVYTNRYGDCKDMATLLVTLLHDAGIYDAYPVLLQAGSDIPVESTLPITEAFDHCIAKATIDGKDYWFDCTAQICGFGAIPGADRGANVLVVKNGGEGDFETIPKFTAPDNGLAILQNVSLNDDGSAQCSDVMTASGDGDLSMRGTFKEIKPNLIQDGIRNIVLRESPNSTLLKWNMTDVNDRDTPFSLTYSYLAPEYAQKTNDLLLFTPSPSPFGENLGSFSKPTRKFPIYSDNISSVQKTVAVQIPTGYSVDGDLPDNMDESLPFAEYTRTVTQVGQTINDKFGISMKQSMTPPDQYSALQQELVKLHESIDKPIVLRKNPVVNPATQ